LKVDVDERKNLEEGGSQFFSKCEDKESTQPSLKPKTSLNCYIFIMTVQSGGESPGSIPKVDQHSSESEVSQ